eukprot:scaffold21.g2122.t1
MSGGDEQQGAKRQKTSAGARGMGADRAENTVVTRARRFVNALKSINNPQRELSAVKKGVKGLLDICKNEDNLDAAAAEGAVEAAVPLLNALNGGNEEAMKQPPSGVEELERDICFILGLLAIKIEHQTAICEAGALPTLVAMIKRYASMQNVALSGVHAQTCRRAADAVTNLAHENNTMKNKVRQEGGIPPLVALLHSVDPKVQRAVAGSLRTLAFKNEENKNIIVELGSLPLLIQMLRSEDSTIHYEAVGVIGNLVHSSGNIKKKVLEEGALQAVINLLSSTCPDSQREAALLLGQFATADGDYKLKIVQRGAVAPLIDMLANSDSQLREMAAFALGRLAQNSDNQAGIVASGGLPPLLDLLECVQGNLQHNAAFALYGLSDNEDNLLEFVREGALQRVVDCLDGKLEVQASKDCVNKMLKRLQDRCHGRVLGQILYLMQGSPTPMRERIAIALTHLVTKETPSGKSLQTMFQEKKGLDLLLPLVTSPPTDAARTDLQRQAAVGLTKMADALGISEPRRLDDIAPPEPKVFLGAQYVNAEKLHDVTFVVEGRPFYAHKIALLASSEIFRTMFDGHYREKDASQIPIPNVRWPVFRAMMTCIYTGTVEVPSDLAQELLEVADQYMLDRLKQLCEAAITKELAPDNVSAAFDLAEAFNAPDLARQCALYCLREHRGLLEAKEPRLSPSSFAVMFQKMSGRLRESFVEAFEARAGAGADADQPQ